MRSSPNFDVIKEPRGFIKCLQVFLAIFAFACATAYRGKFTIYQTAENLQNHNALGEFQYPFEGPIKINMMKSVVLINGSKILSSIDIDLPLDQRASTEFFVVIGVFCFIYSLVMLVYYIFFEEDNVRNAAASSNMFSPPVIDFAFGTFWALFWFFSACAFAAALANIKDLTNADALTSKEGILNPYCLAPLKCDPKNPKYSTLTVATLLGFLNVFVWAGNLWFLWKETPWHTQNSVPAATVQPPQSIPQAAAI